MKFFSMTQSPEPVSDQATHEWAEFNLPPEFQAAAARFDHVDPDAERAEVDPRHFPR